MRMLLESSILRGRDCNPIENLWHKMKELYLRREVKPRTKQQLINGTQAFWGTVDVAKCKKYIRHLRKVIPRVIEVRTAMSVQSLPSCRGHTSSISPKLPGMAGFAGYGGYGVWLRLPPCTGCKQSTAAWIL